MQKIRILQIYGKHWICRFCCMCKITKFLFLYRYIFFDVHAHDDILRYDLILKNVIVPKKNLPIFLSHTCFSPKREKLTFQQQFPVPWRNSHYVKHMMVYQGTCTSIGLISENVIMPPPSKYFCLLRPV